MIADSPEMHAMAAGSVGPPIPSEPDWRKIESLFRLRGLCGLRRRRDELGLRESLIEGLLPKSALALFIGDSGLGKSPFAYQMAVCVATGTPFLGHQVKQGRAIYIDYENGLGQVEGMVSKLSANLGAAPSEHELLLLNGNDLPSNWGQDGCDVIALVKAVQPSLVIIDSLAGFNPEAEEKNAAANRMIGSLRKIISANRCAIMLIHHIRKPSSKPEDAPGSIEDENPLRGWFVQARGAGALFNGTDVRLGVDRPGITTAKKKDAESNIALVMRGLARVQGELPKVYLGRVFNEDGEPVAYRRIAGCELLFNADHEAAFRRLPQQFRFKDAQSSLGKAAQPTTDFLHNCQGAGIVRKLGKKGYEKVGDGGVAGVRGQVL